MEEYPGQAGGFHTMMNGIGAGYHGCFCLRTASGGDLSEKHFQHIMSGRSYSRVTWSNILIFAAISDLTATAVFSWIFPVKSKGDILITYMKTKAE